MKRIWVFCGVLSVFGLGSALAQAPMPPAPPVTEPPPPEEPHAPPTEEVAAEELPDDAGVPEVDGGSSPEQPVEAAQEGKVPPAAAPSQVEPVMPALPVESAPPADAFAEPTDALAESRGRPKEVPGSNTSLDEGRLGLWEHDDVHQVLMQVPGVYVRQEEGYGLRPNIGMRGADSDRSKKVTLMEDGVLLGPAPYSAPAAYYVPLITRMHGVEVLKGAPLIRVGPSTVGGAVDLHTRGVPDEGRVGAADLSFGNTFYTKLHAYGGYGWEQGGFLAEGASVSSTGFKELDGGGDTGFSKQEFMLKGRFNTRAGARIYQRLELKAGYTREDAQETYLGLSDGDFRDSPVRRYRASQLDNVKSWRTQGEVVHRLGVGQHFALDTTLYRHDFSSRWERAEGLVFYRPQAVEPTLAEVLRAPEAHGQVYDTLRGRLDSDSSGVGILQAGNERRFVSQGIQTVGRHDFQTGPVQHDVELGLRLHHDQVEREHSAHGYEMAPLYDYKGDPIGDTLHLRPDREERPDLAHNEVSTLALAVHLVYDLTFKGLTLSPGVRAEVIRATYTERLPGQRFGVVHETRANTQTLLFALGARYAINDELSVLAGVQQGMTPVAPDPGTPDDDPERALNYELGARYSVARGTVSVLGFASDYERIVAGCDDGPCGSSSNTGSATSGAARVLGLELFADYTLALPGAFRLPVRAAYTYTHAEFTETFDSSYPLWAGDAPREIQAGEQLPYVPPHQYSLGTGLSFREKVGLDTQVTFVDRMREQAGKGEPAPGEYTDRYALLDLTAFYQVLARLCIYVKGENLTNNQPLVSRRPLGARPSRPLLVQAGFKWEM